VLTARRINRRILAAAGLVIVFAGACGGGEDTTSTPPASAAPSGAPGLDQVRLLLQWTPQAQFAGYYAAVEQGYFEANGLDVIIVAGGPDVSPQQAGSSAVGPEFVISWVPKVLEAREASPASDLVNIAQVFQRSGTLAVSWRESAIISPADFRDRKVGVWGFGNEFEVTAGTRKVGLEPGDDYAVVTQGVDMTLLLSKQVDVGQAMIYNEYAQILETTNPETDRLYQPTDLNVINWVDEGSAMLQDAVFSRASWLAEAGNEDIARRFLEASFQGWIYCRTNPDDCITYTIDAGAAFADGTMLGAGHQAWMLNEVDALIWPSPDGIGIMDPAKWRRTVEVLLEARIIEAEPPPDAYRTDLAAAALAGITDDSRGADFQKGVVEIRAGGN
jgi:NitT/TauT family transport system substrate-binding protein